MDNMKFIARSMAIGAIFTGVSSQVNAQQGCPLNVGCPPDYTQDTATFTDQWGQDFIPDTGEIGLQVPQFDKSVYAALHGVPEADIVLAGVEVTLTASVDEMFWTITPDIMGGDCTFEWSWPVQVTIQPNVAVGTPEIATTPIVASDSASLMAGETYAWDLDDDGPGRQESSECFGTTVDLPPWIGNGDVAWDVDLVALPTQSGCSNSVQQRQVKGTVDVEVKYIYCYTIDDPVGGGCVCDRPSPNYRRPGSLLLYPEFNTRQGELTLVTITNVDCVQNSGQNVDVEFVFIDGDDCTEFNRTETLTPCDTLTFLANALNPNQEEGYLYAFAKEYDGGAPNGTPIAWNHLVGNLMMISGFTAGFDYSMNPVVFRSPLGDGNNTDLDGDGNRDLDSMEYQPAPNVITIPRYFGQDVGDGNSASGGYFESQLILIGLSGGQQFTTQACFTIYNDNEVVFSNEYEFECWEKPKLLDITPTFANWFLSQTDNDPDEIFGHSDRESGWMCIEGCLAYSDSETIQNPAIYAALIENVGSYSIADLPFECGIRTNGALLPRGQFGDPDEDTDSDGDVDEDDAQDGDNQ